MHLDEIIEQSYMLFENYTIGGKLQLCACCVSLEEEKELINTPLRQVSNTLLQRSYYDSARNYSDRELWEMKHFLPRVLELVSRFEFPCHSTEITFGRLELDKPEKWTEQEIKLLTDFSIAYIKYCLNTYPLPNGIVITDILIMFGIGYFDLKAIVNEWTNIDNTTSILHLKDLIVDDIEYKIRGPYKLANPFSTAEVDSVLINWLNNKTVKEKFSKQIENIIMGSNKFEEETISQLSLTYELLKIN